MEAILVELERVNPERLPGKKTVFRNDVLGALNLRAELNVGWMLAQTQCRFDFAREGQPDYECSLESGTAWVEVTTKSRDDLSQLHDDLTKVLRGRSVVAQLHIPRLLVIPEQQRKEACALVLDAVDSMTGSYASVGLPKLGGSVILNAPSLFGGPHVVLDTASSDLTAHGERVEQFFLNSVADKVTQSLRGDWDRDTVLVVDASRLGLGWLRPDGVWAGRLDSMGLVWDEIPFAALAVVFSDLRAAGYHGSCVTRPDMAKSSASRVGPLLRHLGFDISSSEI
jgi:hypothetical protein